MKFLITGDWHITSRRPRYRIDNYFETLIGKITYLLDYAKDNDIEYILQPGDFFDSHRVSDFVKQHIITLLKQYKIPIICVYGQHDLRYHGSNRKNTPLGVLEAAGVVKTLSHSEEDGTYSFNLETGDHEIAIFGSSWGEEIPVQNDGCICIWITHRMVIKDKLWEAQKEYSLGNALLKRTEFELIVSGDNHESFHFEANNQSPRSWESVQEWKWKKWLINCGSLMRSTVAQLKHKPCFWTFDSTQMGITQHFIPIKPIKEVMNWEQAQEEKVKNQELENFIEGLKGDVELHGVDFKRNLKEYLEEKEVPEGVDNMIKEMME